jgi:uncharacterized protein (TIGR01741 family)
MSIESRLSEYYQKIARSVSDMIPDTWNIFYLSIELNDEGGGTAYFFYGLDGADDELCLSHNIPKDYDMNQSDYLSSLRKLLEVGKNMRQVFIEEEQKAWYTFAMIVTSQGKMKAEFGYTNWLKSDYPNYELMDYFVYKYIDKKYLNANQWGKMEEIKMYDETSNHA